MKCQRCSAENASVRKFCRDCGSVIVSFCQRCGFGNGPEDKYCGGCGINLAEARTEGTGRQDSAPVGGGTYSPDELQDLLRQQSPKAALQPKKKGVKPDAVSQDLLDSIFNSSDPDY